MQVKILIYKIISMTSHAMQNIFGFSQKWLFLRQNLLKDAANRVNVFSADHGSN